MTKAEKKKWKGRLHSPLHLHLHLHLSRSHGDRLGATDLATLSLHLQVYLSSGYRYPPFKQLGLRHSGTQGVPDLLMSRLFIFCT